MLGYYKRLWKNKKSVYIVVVAFFIIGLIPIVYNLIETKKLYIDVTVPPTLITDSPILGFFAYTNWGMVILGILVIYIALIFVPRNAPDAQNPDDYTVKIKGEKIYIKFKNYEFEIPKDKFEPTSLLFRDKNHKFVPITLGYQIYNYVNDKYNDEINKK